MVYSDKIVIWIWNPPLNGIQLEITEKANSTQMINNIIALQHNESSNEAQPNETNKHSFETVILTLVASSIAKYGNRQTSKSKCCHWLSPRISFFKQKKRTILRVGGDHSWLSSKQMTNNAKFSWNLLIRLLRKKTNSEFFDSIAPEEWTVR